VKLLTFSAGVWISLFLAGCATQLEQQSERELRAVSDARTQRQEPSSSAQHAPSSARQPAPSPENADGSLAAYVRSALENSPALRASFEEWRASAQRIRQARRLPEPVITYGYFVRRVETRVGPQRHKFGISQSFPWPTRLSAGADAASLAARSAQQKYEAAALELTRRVAEAYWRLWLIDRVRIVQQDQKRILEQFSSIVRGRLEVGQTTLADLGQIDLGVSRLEDVLSGLDEQERVASAMLVAAIGAPPGTPTPVTKEDPPLVLPAETDAALRSSAVDHPGVRALGLMADAQNQRARAAGAEAYPSFTLGVDYIETGPAVMPGVNESGKDAIVAMIGAKVPIWGGVYDANEQEAHAESASFRARQAAAQDQAIAELEKALSDVRDAARRVKLHRDTLVPQAQTVYTSGLGAYQVGRSTLASVLMAERDLNDLQLALDRARADHANAWARLEQVVGRPVRSRRAP
jgi:outer membrane protein, heavy metal efflux system